MKEGAPKNQITQAVLEHMQHFSRPISAQAFGQFAPTVQPIIKRLTALEVEVLQTPENFMWCNGAYAQSQLGKCITIKGHGYVFLDLVGPNAHDIELLDTMLHESVHSTGPLVGRWEPEEQPVPEFGTHHISQAYFLEESIAVLGAAKIMAGIFSCSADPSGEWKRIASEVLKKSREVVCDLLIGHGPFPEVEWSRYRWVVLTWA